PRLDLVIYILIAQLTPHHQQQYYKYYHHREMPSWRKEFKKEWNILKTKDLNHAYLTNTKNWFSLQIQKTSSIRQPLLPISTNSLTSSSNYVLASSSNYTFNNSIADTTAVTDNDNSDQLFENYESILQDALLIVQEQRKASNVKWAQAVEKSFNGISNMVTDIKKYKKRTTNPRT
ncbi:4554_t:CDS:2, partial [Gigaspora rosea]